MRVVCHPKKTAPKKAQEAAEKRLPKHADLRVVYEKKEAMDRAIAEKVWAKERWVAS